MRVEGSLGAEPLGDVLRRIGTGRFTGILTLQGEEDILGVTFLEGEIVSVDAVNQAPEEAVGRLLVERGLLTREALATLLAEQGAGGVRMQDLLLEQGLVEPEELADVVREKSLRLCGQALAWQRGRFRFYPNDEVAYEPGMLPIGVEELLSQPVPAPVPPARPSPPVGDGGAPAPAFATLERAASRGGAAREEAAESGPAAAARAATEAASSPWLAGLLALAVGLGLAAFAWWDPTRLYFPLRAARLADAAFGRQQQSAFYLEVDRAAKAFYLLQGSFPESLPELVEGGFLNAGDLGAPRRGPLAYADAPVSYLVLLEGGQTGPGESHRTETVAGHFLLDPGFVAPDMVDAPPIVLLD